MKMTVEEAKKFLAESKSVPKPLNIFQVAPKILLGKKEEGESWFADDMILSPKHFESRSIITDS